MRLKWIDVNEQNSTITINDPEKNSNPRMLKVSSMLIAMLNKLPKTNGDRIFHVLPNSMEVNLVRQRRALAHKLNNPRLLQIHYHTLRHWKATMEYHKTKDILYVKKLLGHKSIENTMVYTQLIDFQSDEYHSATANSIDEASKLVEAGFEYVLTNNGVMLFKKRK